MTAAGTLARWIGAALGEAEVYAHGLDVAAEVGDVTGAPHVSAWLADLIRLGPGRADAAVMAAVLQGHDPGRMAALLRTMAVPPERWGAEERYGRAFARIVGDETGEAMAVWPLPVAAGIAAWRLGLDPGAAVRVYLDALTEPLLAEAVRLRLLEPGEVADIAEAVAPVIAGAAAEALEAVASMCGNPYLGNGAVRLGA